MYVCVFIIVESSRREVDEIIHRNLLAGVGTVSNNVSHSYWTNTVLLMISINNNDNNNVIRIMV